MARSPDRATPALGHLGRFQLEKLLGQGAFGKVFKAYDPQLDRFVALKIPTFGPQDTHKIQRFIAEAKAAAKLRHPSIVPTYESGQIEGQYYIAAQFVPGQTLAHRIKESSPLAPQGTSANSPVSSAKSPSSRGSVVARSPDRPTAVVARSPDRATPGILTAHRAPVTGVAFNRAGKLLVTSSADRTCILWDLVTLTPLARFAGHTDHVTAVAFAPDGTRFATASADRTIKLWDIAATPEPTYLPALENTPLCMTFLAQNSNASLAVCSNFWSEKEHGLSLLAYDVAKVSQSAKRTATTSLNHFHAAQMVAAANTSPTLAMLEGRANRTDPAAFALWEPFGSNQIQKFDLPSISPDAMALTPDGKVLIIAGSTNAADQVGVQVHFFDLTTRKHIRTLYFKDIADVRTIAITSDQAGIAVASSYSVQFFSAHSGEPTMVLVGKHAQSAGDVRPLAFSPNGEFLASGGDEYAIRLWSVEARKDTALLTGHTDVVTSLAFSPDSKTLVSASADRTIRLWHIATGQQLLVLNAHQNPVRLLAFSSDGALLATADSRGQVCVYHG